MALRAMLAVPYFEKALYELPEDQLSVQAVLDLADKIEVEIQVLYNVHVVSWDGSSSVVLNFHRSEGH
jgi:hypothetical protein